jgi:hypothetical protein
MADCLKIVAVFCFQQMSMFYCHTKYIMVYVCVWWVFYFITGSFQWLLKTHALPFVLDSTKDNDLKKKRFFIIILFIYLAPFNAYTLVYFRLTVYMQLIQIYFALPFS